MHIDSILRRRVVEIIDENHLSAALKSKKKLRVKLGIDPTGADLHLGHAVTLWKLREFQNAGHKAVLIIGDWTAMIGDPSGKNETRKTLTEKEIAANSKHFFDQANLILDKNKTEVHLQSEWFAKFDLKEFIRLGSKISTGEMLSHETFRNRLQNDLPYAFHENFYPLLQGYDSIAVKADVELGAMEQKFNLLMGRKLQKFYNQTPQDLMMLKYLIGLDGREKMGKTLGNYIALLDTPEEMFGKVMSIPDELIVQYFELCTEISEKEVQQIIAKGNNPKNAKMHLAEEIVTIYHGRKKAAGAAEAFQNKFSRGTGEIKADFTLKKKPGTYAVADILVEGKLAISKSEARRKIKEGAVEVDGGKIKDEHASVKIAKDSLIRLGKRFLRII